jgi:hypothetical protein
VTPKSPLQFLAFLLSPFMLKKILDDFDSSDQAHPHLSAGGRNRICVMGHSPIPFLVSSKSHLLSWHHAG